MTKTLRTVAITLHDESTVTFTDTATYTGGTIAWDQVQYDRDIRVPNAAGTEITFIPFHAVVKAVATISTTEVTDPEDAFCA